MHDVFFLAIQVGRVKCVLYQRGLETDSSTYLDTWPNQQVYLHLECIYRLCVLL